jgi:hypothetical protein
MNKLPNEMIDEIAKYLNKRDLVNFAITNKQHNEILSNRLEYEKEKYKFDEYHEYNRFILVTNYRYKRENIRFRDIFKCIICGCHTIDNPDIWLCEDCRRYIDRKLNHDRDLLKKIIYYECFLCVCIMREVRMMLLQCKDIRNIINNETISKFKDDEVRYCLMKLKYINSRINNIINDIIDNNDDSNDSYDYDDSYDSVEDVDDT